MSELVLGAVAYDPKVVTIWDGFRVWLREQGLAFDYVLYSNYERQVEELVAGRIQLAWNSPLAWVRATRLARAADVTLRPVVMRDTDCDLSSVIVIRQDSPAGSVKDLRGLTVATGAVDSPQATLLPLALLRDAGLRPDSDVQVRRFDIGVGLHGDHIGGEREAARALAAGQVDAACMVDSNLLLFAREGILPSGAARIVAQTLPYDHCTMTAGPTADADLVEEFRELLLGMSYADPELRPLLDLEGLHEWRPARLMGYQQLEGAVEETGFYDPTGKIGASDYRP
ncbi:MAG TPA: PhnD/SsuA/transferrin family substrate-binding protein [Streptosporangiaceae bacterium]|jgi:ABC-type phosphate/phosphonate transport system substrate-binding protein